MPRLEVLLKLMTERELLFKFVNTIYELNLLIIKLITDELVNYYMQLISARLHKEKVR